MINTPSKDQQKLENAARTYEPEEFEADTSEERPVALLAERRRQFLAGLKASQASANPSANK